MPVRVADAVTQQHDRPQAHPAGVAGRGGGAGQEQAPRSGRAKRASGRREEAEAHVDRGARETVAGSVLRRAAAAFGREDRCHSGKARPEKERGQSVVLQSEAKAKAHEVCGPTLMTGPRAAIRHHHLNPFLRHVLILVALTGNNHFYTIIIYIIIIIRLLIIIVYIKP